MNYLKDIPVGENAPEEFNVVIEIPKGGRNKYEVAKETGVLKLDRVLHTSLAYPTDYGYIPRTWYLDDDPLDVVLWTRESISPKCVVKARPVGVLRTYDKVKVDGKMKIEGQDDKILAVPVNDPFYDKVRSLEDVPFHLLEEIKHFFKRYKELAREKASEVGEWEGSEKAKEAVKKSIEIYKDKNK